MKNTLECEATQKLFDAKIHYLNAQLKVEAPAVLAHRPTPAWPHQGSVEFDGYATRYREGLDLVIKGVTAKIKPKEKV